MRNRAKCKLCNSIIESFHRHDYVTCQCGEISVDGGLDYFRCRAGDWSNFLRVDDEGNEIVPVIKDKEELVPINEEAKKPNRDELIDMLEEMMKGYERLPEHAMLSPVTHADLVSVLLLLLSILRSDCSKP